jgi:hypothetical protein
MSMVGRTPGRTPRSAADALVGLLRLDEHGRVSGKAGPGGPARTRGSAPQFY